MCRKAVVETLPEAVQACAEIGDRRDRQAPTVSAVKVLLLARWKGLHDLE
jgi:hypothetical protein